MIATFPCVLHDSSSQLEIPVSWGRLCVSRGLHAKCPVLTIQSKFVLQFGCIIVDTRLIVWYFKGRVCKN